MVGEGLRNEYESKLEPRGTFGVWVAWEWSWTDTSTQYTDGFVAGSTGRPWDNHGFGR